MTKPLCVLVIEDNPGDAELLILELRHGGYEPEHDRIETREEMSAALDRQSCGDGI